MSRGGSGTSTRLEVYLDTEDVQLESLVKVERSCSVSAGAFVEQREPVVQQAQNRFIKQPQ